MTPRRAMRLSGAAGVLLAALVYVLSARSAGVLSGLLLIPQADVVIFALLLLVSLVEMPVMLFALRALCASHAGEWVYGLNAVYVAFAAVYAGFLVLVAGEANLSRLLAALSLARWASDWWIVGITHPPES